MNLIYHKKRNNSSLVTSAAKMPRVLNNDLPPLPQMLQSDKTSSNKFLPPHSLRHALQTNRCVAPMPQTSQSSNTSMPSTHRIGTRSTTATLHNLSSATTESINNHTHSEPATRILPNLDIQRDASSDNLDQPPAHPVSAVRRHSGHVKKGSGEIGSNNLHRKEGNAVRQLDDELDMEDGVSAGQYSMIENDKHARGPCKQIKTSRIVRISKQKIRVLYNKVTRRATSHEVHSLLAHDIGAIVRSHCPMNTGFWRTIPLNVRKDLMDEITTNYEINLKDPALKSYVDRMYNGRYREFKAELSAYYKSCETYENALAKPPLEMLDRDVDQWRELCNHFNSDKFKKASSANIANRSNKKLNHRTGSRPLSYLVEDMAVDGSKFPEVDAFKLAYGGRDNCWTNDVTKAQYDEMVAKTNEYLTEKAKEQQLPHDVPLEEIHVDDPDAGLNIMMSVLGKKPGRRIRGLGDGRLRDTAASSVKVRHLENELEAERVARKAADVARMETEQRMQTKFNATLQSWHNSLTQMCSQIPGIVLPPFVPLSTEHDETDMDGTTADEDNNLNETNFCDE